MRIRQRRNEGALEAKGKPDPNLRDAKRDANLITRENSTASRYPFR